MAVGRDANSDESLQLCQEIRGLARERQDLLDNFRRQDYPDKMSEHREPLFCSFCRKDQDQVEKLVAGPGVYVCDECIELCNDIIAGNEIETDFPGWDRMTDETLLALLAPSSRLVDNARDMLQQHVDLLRDRGVSWGRIGEALGISRQAAWERFG